ncbi:hypothetical protein [Ammoniphilus sp. CFH 90114]|uniref:hypothetical protein n=1 Tax=Ammoniphilus sp. CFH 90114 TaxID=2493665 RepID=UPI0010100047|nr:hypothetical protein [Ammoniphilus sp. CFH 90114]RXT15275.1 hypothetical protein EIZ39_03440 [Ammoniphilus sp. CFH 90114]
MSLANWSDIIDICKQSSLTGSFHGMRRKKIILSRFVKAQKMHRMAPDQELSPLPVLLLK